jgi:hypothetical protein
MPGPQCVTVVATGAAAAAGVIDRVDSVNTSDQIIYRKFFLTSQRPQHARGCNVTTFKTPAIVIRGNIRRPLKNIRFLNARIPTSAVYAFLL